MDGSMYRKNQGMRNVGKVCGHVEYGNWLHRQLISTTSTGKSQWREDRGQESDFQSIEGGEVSSMND